jgi:hypothetical protein
MTNASQAPRHMGFLEELREQRWDDHRYYHQSRVNQTMHLFSSTCFIATYLLLPFRPVAGVLLGWVIAMWSRQIGHFFFEPRSYDEVNQASFRHKEAIKVGFNLQRKVILFVAWIAVPLGLCVSRSFFGLVQPWVGLNGYLHLLVNLWLVLAGVGLLGRTLFLCVTRNRQTGVVWFVKILTDPFHDVMIYWRAPLHLMRGEWLDPMPHARARP